MRMRVARSIAIPCRLATTRATTKPPRRALLRGADVGDSLGAEAATGYVFGERSLRPHVQRILERARQDGDERLEQLRRALSPPRLILSHWSPDAPIVDRPPARRHRLRAPAGRSGGPASGDAARAAVMQADRDYAAATAARRLDGWMSFLAADMVKAPWSGNFVKGLG